MTAARETSSSASSGTSALRDSTTEIEDYRVELNAVTVLELTIRPNVSGGKAVAALAEWRLAQKGFTRFFPTLRDRFDGHIGSESTFSQRALRLSDDFRFTEANNETIWGPARLTPRFGNTAGTGPDVAQRDRPDHHLRGRAESSQPYTEEKVNCPHLFYRLGVSDATGPRSPN